MAVAVWMFFLQDSPGRSKRLTITGNSGGSPRNTAVAVDCFCRARILMIDASGLIHGKGLELIHPAVGLMIVIL